jgi:regulator of protease activity HflC (stomatin/prohibitin superfamily)
LVKKVLGLVVIAVLSLALLFTSGCTLIEPGHVGIQVARAGANRGVQSVTLRSGWVIYNKIRTQVIEYPTYIQTIKWVKPRSGDDKNPDESITFQDDHGVRIEADISVSYQLDYNKAPEFYVQFRDDDIQTFTDGFMHNTVKDAFNEVCGAYPVEQLMSNSGPVLAKVQELTQRKLDPYGIKIMQLGFLNALRPPDTVTNSINEKVKATQLVLQAQTEVAQAEAISKKNVAFANGDAASTIIRAQAEAQANKLRSESLTALLIENNKVNKWDGHNPNVISGGGGMIVSAK